jgi:hypothetical protein
MLVILLFAFGVVPGLERLEPVREVRDAIQEADIDASALFYTESEVSTEAEASIRNAMEYAAQRAPLLSPALSGGGEGRKTKTFGSALSSNPDSTGARPIGNLLTNANVSR